MNPFRGYPPGPMDPFIGRRGGFNGGACGDNVGFGGDGNYGGGGLIEDSSAETVEFPTLNTQRGFAVVGRENLAAGYTMLESVVIDTACTSMTLTVFTGECATGNVCATVVVDGVNVATGMSFPQRFAYCTSSQCVNPSCPTVQLCVSFNGAVFDFSNTGLKARSVATIRVQFNAC